MISKEQIERLKAEGAWIISLSTWKTWLEKGKARAIGRTRQVLGCVPVFNVNGKIVKTDWLLDYGHRQYERLIPVDISAVEKEENAET